MMVAQVTPHTTVQPADWNTVTTCHALLLCDQLDNNENISTLLADDVKLKYLPLQFINLKI